MVGKFITEIPPSDSWWATEDLSLGPKDSGLCCFHDSLGHAFGYDWG